MKKLKNQQRVPYGGAYVLNVPEKGIVGHGTSFSMLLRSITEWRRANSVPIGLGFENEVEQTVCEKYPDECDDPSSLSASKRSRNGKLRLSTILRGTRVLLAFKIAGSPLVIQELAESRGAICASCEKNVDFSKPCGGNCGGLKEMVKSIIGGNKTPYDAQLKSCSVCGCEASSHIWLPDEFLAKGVTDEMRAEFATVERCWKKNL